MDTFLSEEEFLDYFPNINIDKETFIKEFYVTYRGNPTLRSILDPFYIERKKHYHSNIC